MSHEKTLAQNSRVRLNPQYLVIAGRGPNDVPQLVRVDADGNLGTGGVLLPDHDTIELAYVGSTNNLQTAIFKKANTEVARWTLTYIGGGAADNDRLVTAAFTTP